MSKCDWPFRHCQRSILNLKRVWHIYPKMPKKGTSAAPPPQAKRRDIWIYLEKKKLFSFSSLLRVSFLNISCRPPTPRWSLDFSVPRLFKPSDFSKKKETSPHLRPLPSSHLGRFLLHPSTLPGLPQPLVGLNPHPLLFTSSSGEAERFTPCGWDSRAALIVAGIPTGICRTHSQLSPQLRHQLPSISHRPKQRHSRTQSPSGPSLPQSSLLRPLAAPEHSGSCSFSDSLFTGLTKPSSVA